MPPVLLADDAEHAAHPVHRLVPAQLVDGGQQVALPGDVGEEDQAGLLGQADLLHGAYGDVVVPEDLGHRGQHAGPVGHVHAQVERGAHVVLRAHRRARALRRRRRRTGEEVARGVDQIAQHGAGGRAAPGTAAVEHELAADGALDEHGVEGAPHRGQRVRLGHHGRVDADRDLRPAVDQLGDGEELDRVPEPAGVGDVGRTDAADALAVHVGVDHVAAEGERGQDGRLGGGVVPLHVRRRVALGQAELLRLAQHVVVAVALLLHAREDVVGRAVDDPHDPDDLLAGQRLAQRPDDRDGPGHRRLVEQVHARGGGHLGQLGAGGGQERLVRGDHRLAVAQGRLDQFVRRVEPADDLDHDVDVVPRHQGGGIGPDEVGPDGRRTRALRIGHGDADELQADAGTGGDVVVAGEQDLGQRAADVAAPEQGDTDGRGRVRVRVGAAARRCAGPVGGHLQTVQAARAAAGPFAGTPRPVGAAMRRWRARRGQWCYHHGAPAGWLP